MKRGVDAPTGWVTVGNADGLEDCADPRIAEAARSRDRGKVDRLLDLKALPPSVIVTSEGIANFSPGRGRSIARAVRSQP